MLGSLVDALPPDAISVLAPGWEGAAPHDASKPYRVFRGSTAFAWPSAALRARVLRVIDETKAEVVVFGAASPLAILGPSLAAAGTPYVVIAHGVEYWLSLLPGTHALMRHATSRAARVTACSAFVARTVRTAVPAGVPVSVLPPGADIIRFRPGLETDDLRQRHGIGGRPLVVCVSRLVMRKGQDVLIRSMAGLQRRIPDAALLIVGGGSYEQTLRRLADAAPRGSVFFAGEVSEGDLPRYYAVGDVFAMPCRTRLAGLEVEGWGAVFVEAAACGKPVVAGDSGGAREALVDGETGLLVDGADVDAVTRAIGDLLADPALAHRMGTAGRTRVERELSWPSLAARLAGWIRAAAN
ncbi:MAG: phosphatidyl-myo-inositol dimannoside synthase [Actinomycetota bacterium]|nr:phosphatidyl-myo-inositol dimannoside synthase [Actinomycetota bacterium]